ncbi:hypothetical protein GGQ85_003698 [Nitrobacter vulgaris]|uniref:Plug domain-containing protein n=1 Tax=Nitrobacter vulgaris TaxID=29421 RepID=UPI0028655452|nr:Plug domain-containing protein [Nitrobacter vulgaris]MDR6305970.1 hypothetical protein [Nitrobacter vulgaris]
MRSTVAQRAAAPVRSPAVPYLTPPTGAIGQPPAPYAGGQVRTTTSVGMLGNRNVFDTPFNKTGYTSKLMRDQQANAISDVADNDPSVRTNSPRYSEIDGFLIRGFPVSASDFAFDDLLWHHRYAPPCYGAYRACRDPEGTRRLAVRNFAVRKCRRQAYGQSKSNETSSVEL